MHRVTEENEGKKQKNTAACIKQFHKEPVNCEIQRSKIGLTYSTDF